MSLNLNSLLNEYRVEPSLSGRCFWQKDKEPGGLRYPLPIKPEYLDFMKLILGFHIIEIDRLDTLKELVFETSFPDSFSSIVDQLQSLFLYLTDLRVRLKVVPCFLEGNYKRLDERSSYKKTILFSSGLDSLCGAFRFSKQNAATLTHCQTNQVLFHKVLDLSKIRPLNRSPLFCFNAITKSTTGGPSNTRGLLFLSFAYSVAASLGMESVMFCENGSQMLDVMLGPLVYPNKPATKNTNPIYIEKIERLLSSFSEKNIRIERPFQEFTRAEMLAQVKDQIKSENTFSCFTTRGQSAMCGICYNCFMRRMSLLAIDIKEDPNIYEKSPFESVDTTEQTESYDRNLRIIFHVLRHYAKVLKGDPSTLNEVKLSARNYFKHPIDLVTRSAEDIFLGVMKSLETIGDDRLNPLGMKATELLNQIDKQLLLDRNEELIKLAQSTRISPAH